MANLQEAAKDQAGPTTTNPAQGTQPTAPVRLALAKAAVANHWGYARDALKRQANLCKLEAEEEKRAHQRVKDQWALDLAKTELEQAETELEQMKLRQRGRQLAPAIKAAAKEKAKMKMAPMAELVDAVDEISDLVDDA